MDFDIDSLPDTEDDRHENKSGPITRDHLRRVFAGLVPPHNLAHSSSTVDEVPPLRTGLPANL